MSPVLEYRAAAVGGGEASPARPGDAAAADASSSGIVPGGNGVGSEFLSRVRSPNGAVGGGAENEAPAAARERAVSALEATSSLASTSSAAWASLSESNTADKEALEIVFVYCAIWAFGNGLTISDDGTDYRSELLWHDARSAFRACAETTFPRMYWRHAWSLLRTTPC